MDQVLDVRLFGRIGVLTLMHIRQGPVLGNCMLVANTIDEYQCRDTRNAQAGRQYLCHTTTNALPHEYAVGEIQLIEQHCSIVSIAPDGCVCLPGWIRKDVAEL